MNRLSSGLALAALLSITCIGSTAMVAAAAPKSDGRCTASDVQRVAHHNFDVFTLAFDDDASGKEKARADHIVADCQFRLYDDNDPEDNPNNPEVPHVFAADDYILGGIAVWYTFAELDEFGLTRAQAIADMKRNTEEVFWGPATTPDSQLRPLAVASTPYRDAVLGEELLVGNHRYVLFKAGALAPGEYKWRWERSYDGQGPFVFRGAVTITPG